MIKFGGYLLLFDLIVLLLAGVPAFLFLGEGVLHALALGLAITTALGVASFIPFTRLSEASMNRFMAAMLGGMMIRMVFIGISVAIVFVFTELHQIAFTVGLLFSYICKSVIETYVLTRKHRGQKATPQ
ncbi:hypothetical protein QA596_03510 [Balneolales bacterium ANBcel1]|nr:hypothetical protein [Balneolales bacterium ANBcel1]